MTTIVAWLVLRIVYAWFFLYPVKGLLKDWQGTKTMVRLLIPFGAGFFASVMLVVMVVGAVMILVGFYAQIAGLFLLFYNLFGVLVHRRLAKRLGQLHLSKDTYPVDQAIFQQAISVGQVGHNTSAMKNIVLAAVAFFFMLMGSGPWSLDHVLIHW